MAAVLRKTANLSLCDTDGMQCITREKEKNGKKVTEEKKKMER